MRSKRRWVILWISFLILSSVMVWTEEAFAGTNGRLEAERIRYYKEQALYIAEENPWLEYKDYIISADVIHYYENEDRAIFIGGVVVIQGENRITGDKLTADLNNEEFLIEGQVTIHYVRKGDNEGEKKEKNEVIKIQAEEVQFHSGEHDHLIAHRAVTMEVDDQTISSEYLEYRGDEEVVIARENVVVIGKDDEKMTANEFTLWLDGEEEGFEAVGQVKLEFTIKDDTKENTSAPTTGEHEVQAQPFTNLVDDDAVSDEIDLDENDDDLDWQGQDEFDEIEDTEE